MKKSQNTLRIIGGLWLFYRKMAIPALVISILFGLLIHLISGHFFFKMAGIAFIISSILLQYFVYEVINSKEYYFYYNIGLSKHLLWGASLLVSFLIGLTFIRL